MIWRWTEKVCFQHIKSLITDPLNILQFFQKMKSAPFFPKCDDAPGKLRADTRHGLQIFFRSFVDIPSCFRFFMQNARSCSS